MTKPKPQIPDARPERRYTITVELTAREINALVGRPDRTEGPVAVVVTSADDREHRVNYAEAAVKKFQHAVQDQRP
ncbi:hypothetical protein AB0425_17240 [Actinosynnema sp. NPDC051121]